ncbi:hypothetical protein [Austwickia chelonae]|uniref:hypothetical protein n=1 Tax=Austwickia chelonae TaxID=100225 RepID=UPI0013C2F8D4|nr:hypothetical protein [Austwickia chelonae]
MCRAVTCSRCQKTTWAGCGKHVDQVMSGVPTDRRCICPRDAGSGGFLSKILGR